MAILSSKSQWGDGQIRSFLIASITPLRLAVMDGEYPLICSMWYLLCQDNAIMYCAANQNSKVVHLLRRNSNVGFEVAVNEPPYKGVRGKARAAVSQQGGAELLGRLADRYLGDDNAALKLWLSGRSNGECALSLEPVWWTAWDYSSRMRAPA